MDNVILYRAVCGARGSSGGSGGMHISPRTHAMVDLITATWIENGGAYGRAIFSSEFIIHVLSTEKPKARYRMPCGRKSQTGCSDQWSLQPVCDFLSSPQQEEADGAAVTVASSQPGWCQVPRCLFVRSASFLHQLESPARPVAD